MALDLNTNPNFSGRITAPDANYPYGSSKDESSPGANDGTPYIKQRADDIFGLQQAILAEAGISPSGSADTALASQYLNGLKSLLAGGKRNHIIDGGFTRWDESTSQTSNGYGSDTMYFNQNVGSTKTHSQQVFTLGQTDVPGNPEFFSRTVVSSVAGAANNCKKDTRIEGVDTLSGESVLLSFYAKADAAKDIAIELYQGFGSGGLPSSDVVGIGSQKVTLSTAWERYVFKIDIPSTSAKTKGTNGDDFLQVSVWFDAGSSFDSRTDTLGQQSGTFDLWGWKLEQGTDIEQVTDFEILTASEIDDQVGRFFEKSYDLADLPGATTTNGQIDSSYQNAGFSGITQFIKRKRATPAITIYNPVTGSPGSVRNGSINTNETSSISFNSESSFLIQGTTSVVGHRISAHFVADARL